MDNSTQAWSPDPMKQPVNLEAVKNTNPKGAGQPKANHPALDQPDKLKDSGKDIGLINAPIVSVNPSSGSTLASEKALDNIKTISNPNRFLNHSIEKQDFIYPFDDTKPGNGFFIPVEAGGTTDALISKLHHQIYTFQRQTSECEKDENGDDVWESIVIQVKKRKDGVIELDGAGNPIVGANQTNRPKLIHTTNFIVRAVVKGDKMGDEAVADTDGALVICV